MKTRNNKQTVAIKRNLLVLVGVLLLVAAVVAAPVYLVTSNASGNSSRQKSLTSGQVDSRWSTILSTIMPAPPPMPGITTYESPGCTNPKSSFNLGETVCAKFTGAAAQINGLPTLRIGWVSPYGSLAQGAVVTTDPQTGTYAIPATPTQTFTGTGGETVVVDNRGVWTLALFATSDGSRLQSVDFTVHDPANEYVDLSVNHGVTTNEAETESGSGNAFRFFVENHGPDTAHDVVVSDTIPANTTFSSLVENTTLGFSCGAPDGGVVNCTIASLPAGAEASFTLAYDVNTGVPVGTLLTNVVTASSSNTPCPSTGMCEIQPADNTSTGTSKVPAQAGTETCALICHENFSVIANTTQGGNPGAFVTFASTGGIFGNCGVISANPASGSFFGLGTTVVNVTSEIGGGSCSFTITVVQATAPTISCPSDKTATADAGGNPPTQHSFTAAQIGTPTTNPPDGVSVTFERSDNIPPTYNDDGSINNPGTVFALTDPFSIGTTGITWTVTDANGLKASCTQRIIVNGTCPDGSAAPTITAPANITTATGPNSTTCGVVLDDELGQPVVNDSTTCPATVSVSGVPPGNLFPIGTTTLTYTASNAAGTATATQTVTVSDNTPPVIFAPANASYTCPEQVPALSPSQAFGPNFETGLPDPTKPVFDNCGPPTVTATQITSGIGSAANPLIITRTYSALDSHGNTANAVQIITVTDSTPPTIGSCPANIVKEPTCPSGAKATYSAPSASDNCAGVTVTPSIASGSVFPIGTTTVTYTATDWAGNTATCSFTVTVKTVQQTLSDMIAAVNALQPPLTGTQVQGLNSKLQAALDAFNQGKTNVACNKLSDFISQVSAYINNGTLTSAQGTPLINSANHVRNTIGCTNNPCS